MRKLYFLKISMSLFSLLLEMRGIEFFRLWLHHLWKSCYYATATFYFSRFTIHLNDEERMVLLQSFLSYGIVFYATQKTVFVAYNVFQWG